MLEVFNSTCRTHKNSGERIITIELLRQVAHLPQQQAADKLNVGNTRFKVRSARHLNLISLFNSNANSS